MPTPEQLAARLNPTPSNIQMPSAGLFRAVGDFGTAIFNANGQQFDILNAFGGGAASGDAGGQAGTARRVLMERYGIDFNSLPQVNIGDYIQKKNDNSPESIARGPRGFMFQMASDPNAFFGNPKPATLAPVAINTEKNTLGAPVTPVAAPGAPAPAAPTAPTAPQGAPQVPNIQNNLTKGMKGPEVQALQQWLISQGYGIPDGATGFYGDQTKAAVAQWQKAEGLNIQDPTAYGSFGPISRSALAQKAGTAAQGQPKPGAPADTGALSDLYGTDMAKITNDIRQKYGLPALDGKKTVVQQAIDDYTQIYSALGIPTIKAAYDAAVKEFSDVQNELNDKISNINDDPWLSEGVRIERNNKLKEKYATKLDIATNKMQLFQSQINQGTSQANSILGEVHNIQQSNEQAVNKAIDIAQKAVDAENALRKAAKSSASIKSVQGGLYDTSTKQWIVPPKDTSAAKPISLTPEDRRNLIGSGFSSQEITDIQNDINQYGIDRVLEGITDTKQKAALQKVYGIKTAEASKLTRSSLATLFGISDDNTKTDWWGFAGKTNKEKLDDLISLVERYKAVGYSDAQILALMK